MRQIFPPPQTFFISLYLLTLAGIFLIVPEADFGQREHFFLVLTMPYFLLVVCRLQKNPVNCLASLFIGVVAAFGFAIKPYFLVPWICIELYCILYTRYILAWVRIETLIIIGLLIFYSGIIFLFYADYLFTIVPYAMRLYYLGMHDTWPLLIFNMPVLFCYLTALLFIINRPLNAILNTVLLITFSSFFLFIYLAQRITLYYHLYPTFSIALLMLVISFASLLQSAKLPHYYKLLAVFIFAFIFTWFFYQKSLLWTILIFQPGYFFSFFAILFSFIFYFYFPRKNIFLILAMVALINVSSYLFFYFSTGIFSLKQDFFITVLFILLLYFLPLSKKTAHQTQLIYVALLAILFLDYPFYYIYNRYAMSHNQKIMLQDFNHHLEKYIASRSVYVFATEYILATDSAFSFSIGLKEMNVKNVSRFPFFWMIPGLIKQNYLFLDAAHQEQNIKDKNFLIGMIAEDLNITKPHIVLIDTNDQKHRLQNINFNYLAYFSHNAAFREAWTKYHYVTQLEYHGYLRTIYRFAVYQREP